MGADLTGVRGVNEREIKAIAFGSIPDRCNHQIEKPAIQPSAGSLADMFFFGLGLEVQILKNQHCMFRNPFTKLSGSFSAKSFIPVMLLSGQPFQRPTNRPGIAALCLLPGKFGLQARTKFTSFSVADGKRFSADKKRFFFNTGNQSVVNTKIDTDRHDAFRLWNLQSDTEESFAVGNTKTVNIFSISSNIKVFTERLRNFPANFLSSLECRDRQTSVSTKRKVFGVKKKCCWIMKNKRTFSRFLIRLCRSISRCCRSNSAATHLRSQSSRRLVINRMVQFKCPKRIAVVEPNRAYHMLIPIELNNGIIDEIIAVKNYRYRPLNVHIGNIVIHSEEVNFLLKERSGNSSHG